MPVYAYACQDCRKTFEIVRSVSQIEKRPPACPFCKGHRIERVWSGVNVHTSRKS
jgi:putative FmdB family regulatory protein